MKRKYQRGFTVLEALFGAAILTVAVVSVSGLVMNFKTRSRSLEASLSCRSRAEAVIKSLKNIDNKLNVNNFQACPNCAGATPSVASDLGLKHPERFEGNNIPLVQPSLPFSYKNTNTWMLIDNGLNIALNLYNKKAAGGTDYCTPPGAQFAGTGAVIPGANLIATDPTSPPPAGVIDLVAILNQVNNGVSLNQEKDFLQVSLYDFTSSKVVLPPCGSAAYTSPGYAGPQRIIPLGSQNSLTLETKLGIQIQSTVQYVDQTGTQKQCSASTILKVDGNTQPPQFLRDPEVLFADQFANYKPLFDCSDYNPYVCMGERAALPSNGVVLGYPYSPKGDSNPTHIFCGTPTTSADVHFTVAVNNPAVTFGCYFQWNPANPIIDSATGVPGYVPPINPNNPPVGSQFQSCDGGTFTIPSGATFTTSLTQVTTPTALPIPLPTPVTAPPGAVYVSPGSVTAAEITAQGMPDGWYTIYIRAYDSSQNQNTVAQSFGVDNLRPDTVANPFAPNYNLTPPANIIKYAPGIGLYQCQPSDDMSYWTATSSNSNGVVDVAPTGVRWKLDGADMNNDECHPNMLVSSTLTSSAAGTVHTITAYACDNCNPTIGAGPLPEAFAPVTQTWTLYTAATCPIPQPPPPPPGPTPVPTPVSCCMEGGASCTGSAGVCNWSPVFTQNYYSIFYLTGVNIMAPGATVPVGTPGCVNQANCSAPPNSSGYPACVMMTPCPVLLQTGAGCVYNNECSSHICAPSPTSPTMSQCQ
jgi:hypothetical protein